MSLALSLVRNKHAVMAIVRATRKWPPLPAPVFPMETHARYRAQSLLTGPRYRDGSTNPDTLTFDQAQDVLRWAERSAA